eukprot:766464-Hanusia_phi.AAC.2
MAKERTAWSLVERQELGGGGEGKLLKKGGKRRFKQQDTRKDDDAMRGTSSEGSSHCAQTLAVREPGSRERKSVLHPPVLVLVVLLTRYVHLPVVFPFYDRSMAEKPQAGKSSLPNS